MEPTRNLPIQLVYWFLLAVTVLFAAFALREVNRWRLTRTVEFRVVDRTVRLEVREIRGKRGPFKVLFAVGDLRLERGDTRAVVNLASERRVEVDDVLSHAFLDAWERGARITGTEREGAIDLDGAAPWAGALGLGMGMWMFGTFAFLTKRYGLGDGDGGLGLPFLALAVLPVGIGAFGVWHHWKTEEEAKAVERVAVEGRGRSMAMDAFLAELAGMGVKVGDGVKSYLDKDEVRFCEYEWEGRKLRSVTMWVQLEDGQVHPGRVNRVNPRDVKWGDQT